MNRRSFLITAAATATTLNLARSAPGQAVGSIQEPASLTIQKAAELIRSRQLSPTDLTRACLERIERYNPSPMPLNRPPNGTSATSRFEKNGPPSLPLPGQAAVAEGELLVSIKSIQVVAQQRPQKAE